MKISRIQGLSSEDKKALRVFSRVLRKALGNRVRQVVLYGSKARGASHPDSDIDVLVVVDRESSRVHDAVADAAYEATVNSTSFVSPQTVSENYWRKSLHRRTFFSRNVEREGVEISQ
ncbi:MAG: nucleotidyltransferase domain-containing protein [Actinobacteria bacterium]|nr:MAG: nucleotidyltransferase domain-containing protein [Actinomycetota bacterium]